MAVDIGRTRLPKGAAALSGDVVSCCTDYEGHPNANAGAERKRNAEQRFAASLE